MSANRPATKPAPTAGPFIAETKEDALDYLKHMGHAKLGKLREITDEG